MSLIHLIQLTIKKVKNVVLFYLFCYNVYKAIMCYVVKHPSTSYIVLNHITLKHIHYVYNIREMYVLL